VVESVIIRVKSIYQCNTWGRSNMTVMISMMRWRRQCWGQRL